VTKAISARLKLLSCSAGQAAGRPAFPLNPRPLPQALAGLAVVGQFGQLLLDFADTLFQ